MEQLDNIQNLIYVIRGQRVMLDFDLAMLYEVETRSLNQTVKRNNRRFPPDFMFQLTDQEWYLISSQFVMRSRMKRPKISLPYAFTELGALMLSSVLRSPVADKTSIKITRAFVAMRQMLTYSTLPEKVVTLAQELYKLKQEVNDILADQNDIRSNLFACYQWDARTRAPVRSSMPSAPHWQNFRPSLLMKSPVALSALSSLKTMIHKSANTTISKN